MDLTTNGVVVTDAIKYVQGQMDHLNKSEKVLLQNIKEKNEEQPERNTAVEEKTNNGIF
jgi:hemerythrin-like domain-containing protein